MMNKKFTIGRKSYRTGGKIQGPSHLNGGTQVYAGGDHIAEVEGGERIFSVKDTAVLEAMATKIANLPEGPQKDYEAKKLGMSIISMLRKQEEESSPERQAEIEEEMLQQGAAAGDVDDVSPDLIIE